MYLLEFSIAHEGCVVNELSRAVPNVRFVCPGGFVINENAADEILALDDPTDSDLESVIKFMNESSSVDNFSIVEKTINRVFIYFRSASAPEVGYCSEAVERNHCFGIGHEIQHKGLEQWRVGCKNRSDAEGLVNDLKGMGDLQHHKISEVSWEELSG